MIFFEDYIKNIAIFLILQAFLNMLVDQQSFQKYLQLVTSFILLFILLQPLTKILHVKNLDIPTIFQAKENILNQKLWLDHQMKYEKQQNEWIIENYKVNIRENITTLAKQKVEHLKLIECFITLELDCENERYMEVSKLELIFTKNTIQIHEIEIMKETKTSNLTKEEEKSITRLKSLLKDFYNLSDDNIHIIVQTNE